MINGIEVIILLFKGSATSLPDYILKPAIRFSRGSSPIFATVGNGAAQIISEKKKFIMIQTMHIKCVKI